MNKRVVRVLVYDGPEAWLDATLRSHRSPFRSGGKQGDVVTFDSGGSIAELHRIEMQEGEDLEDAIIRAIPGLERGGK